MSAVAVPFAVSVSLACAHRGELVVDYMFSVLGTVVGPTGDPIEDAAVVLEVGEPVYEGVTSVRTRVFRTDRLGRFAIGFLTHNPATPYVLRVEKAGFAVWTIAGTSPPYQEHTVTLERLVEDRVPPDASAAER
jgi:hypothetical protein